MDGPRPFPSTTAASDTAGDGFAITRRQLDEDTCLVIPAGELDLASAPNLKWTLNDVLRGGATNIALDLELVSFIDSTALGVLVGVRRSLAEQSHLAIVGGDAHVLQIFELTGLDARFNMFATLDEALAWMRGKAAAAG
jgi:anti-sigma B factor antagonist